MMPGGLSAVVFDLDGTLADTLPDVVGALNRVLAQDGLGRVSNAQGRALVGDGARSLVERAYSVSGRSLSADEIDERVERFIGHYRADPVRDTRLYPGVREVLARFSADGVKLGVCTNKPHEMTRLVLERLELAPLFGSVIGAGALRVRKPDPYHLLAVIEALGADRKACIFVGDSATDVETARNAGVPVIAIGFGYSRVPATELGADVVIERFADLPQAIRGLGRPRQARA